jgi:hypothetical protein
MQAKYRCHAFEHAAAWALATWFGLGASSLSTVLPNNGRFAQPNLGFL